MPGMTSNVGLALGTMAQTFGEEYTKKTQQEHDDKMEKAKLVQSLVMEGLRSGSLENPEKAIPFLLEQYGIKEVVDDALTAPDRTESARRLSNEDVRHARCLAGLVRFAVEQGHIAARRLALTTGYEGVIEVIA